MKNQTGDYIWNLLFDEHAQTCRMDIFYEKKNIGKVFFFLSLYKTMEEKNWISFRWRWKHTEGKIVHYIAAVTCPFFGTWKKKLYVLILLCSWVSTVQKQCCQHKSCMNKPQSIDLLQRQGGFRSHVRTRDGLSTTQTHWQNASLLVLFLSVGNDVNQVLIVQVSCHIWGEGSEHLLHLKKQKADIRFVRSFSLCKTTQNKKDPSQYGWIGVMMIHRLLFFLWKCGLMRM